MMSGTWVAQRWAWRRRAAAREAGEPSPLSPSLTQPDGGGEGGALGVAGEAVDGVVAGGGVGRVDGGVAKAVALRDNKAAGGALVEGGSETGDVEPCAVLGGGEEFVVGDGGGGQGWVGRGEEIGRAASRERARPPV